MKNKYIFVYYIFMLIPNLPKLPKRLQILLNNRNYDAFIILVAYYLKRYKETLNDEEILKYSLLILKLNI